MDTNLLSLFLDSTRSTRVTNFLLISNFKQMQYAFPALKKQLPCFVIVYTRQHCILFPLLLRNRLSLFSFQISHFKRESCPKSHQLSFSQIGPSTSFPIYFFGIIHDLCLALNRTVFSDRFFPSNFQLNNGPRYANVSLMY